MNIQTQEELLLFLLVPYINNELGTNILASDLSIKYLENDQNSNLAFHIFSTDLYAAFNLRVYLQYGDIFEISEFYFEDSISNTGIEISIVLSNENFTFSLKGSTPINLLLSIVINNEFFDLLPGDILPIDYVIKNVVDKEFVNYDILLLDNNAPLLINGTAIMAKES